jgi:hypothetical protein
MSETLHQLLPYRSDAFRIIVCAKHHVFMHPNPNNKSKMLCPVTTLSDAERVDAFAAQEQDPTPCHSVPVVIPYGCAVLLYELLAIGILVQVYPASHEGGSPQIIPTRLKASRAQIAYQ